MLSAMSVHDVALDSIDFGDETHRISEELDSAAMRISLEAVGLLNPVLLLEEPSRRTIVCGFRRLRALRALGQGSVQARTLEPSTSSRLETFRLALFDNLSVRELNSLEKARVLSTLRSTCGISSQALVDSYLPLLGLPPHKNVLHVYLRLHRLVPGLRRLFNVGRLTQASVERVCAFSVETQQKLAALLEVARLSASRQREVLDLAEDLAGMAGTELGEIVGRAEIVGVLQDSRLSAFQKGERIYGLLYRWRNPRLSAVEERFRAGRKLLHLPDSVRISPDPYFETSRLRVEFDAASPQRFREIAAALGEASESAALEELFMP
jgi:hypothetical protein